MKAVVLKRAGSAKHLSLTEVAEPSVGSGEMLVRVHATSVTRGDVVMRKMPRMVARLFGETPKSILGSEFAGVVEQVDANVTDFEVGDRVFGTTDGLASGAYAEYLAVPARGIVASIPAGVGFTDAAPVPVGAMTALHLLRSARAGADSRVLVIGASGSVGSYAVQMAVHAGAHVAGVASTGNADLVRTLGVDEVIDYKVRDVTEEAPTWDVVLDAAGVLSSKSASRILAPGGNYVTTRMRWEVRREDLYAVRDLLSSGAIWPVVDCQYSLHSVPEAHEYVERGRKKGNVVVVVRGD